MDPLSSRRSSSHQPPKLSSLPLPTPPREEPGHPSAASRTDSTPLPGPSNGSRGISPQPALRARSQGKAQSSCHSPAPDPETSPLHGPGLTPGPAPSPYVPALSEGVGLRGRGLRRDGGGGLRRTQARGRGHSGVRRGAGHTGTAVRGGGYAGVRRQREEQARRRWRGHRGTGEIHRRWRRPKGPAPLPELPLRPAPAPAGSSSGLRCACVLVSVAAGGGWGRPRGPRRISGSMAATAPRALRASASGISRSTDLNLGFVGLSPFRTCVLAAARYRFGPGHFRARGRRAVAGRTQDRVRGREGGAAPPRAPKGWTAERITLQAGPAPPGLLVLHQHLKIVHTVTYVTLESVPQKAIYINPGFH